MKAVQDNWWVVKLARSMASDLALLMVDEMAAKKVESKVLHSAETSAGLWAEWMEQTMAGVKVVR